MSPFVLNVYYTMGNELGGHARLRGELHVGSGAEDEVSAIALAVIGDDDFDAVGAAKLRVGAPHLVAPSTPTSILVELGYCSHVAPIYAPSKVTVPTCSPYFNFQQNAR